MVRDVILLAFKRKQEEEHNNNERWLLTYADLITLLMIFFVIMYAMSNVDAKKYRQLSDTLKESFGAQTFTNSQDGSSIDTTESDIINSGDFTEQLDPGLLAAAEDMKRLLKEKGLEGKVSVNIRERGVVIGLLNTVLFEPGSANIREEAKDTLIVIGQIAKTADNYIRVEGHADDIPINTPRFPSNWELSMTRATEVLKLLISESGVSPETISAVGYGEYRPSVPNTSAENRAFNRRVDIILLNSSYNKSEASLSTEE
jgi:chemotaxis protein MotB